MELQEPSKKLRAQLSQGLDVVLCTLHAASAKLRINIACNLATDCVHFRFCVQPGQGWHARFVALNPLVGKVLKAVWQRRFGALLARQESLQGCSRLDLSRPHAWTLFRGKGGIGFTARVQRPY